MKKEAPSLIFLSETKLFSHEFERVKRRLDLFGVCVEPSGRAGGLCLLWGKDLKVELQREGQWFIDAYVHDENDVAWRFSSIYGWSENGSKFLTCELLRDLGRNNMEPWVIMGDFNEILYETEKRGGASCDRVDIQRFRSVVDDLSLRDVQAEGYPFT